MKHGECDTPEYRSWNHMKSRCNCPNTYPGYTQRGITYDPRWEDYVVFLTDMGRRPTPKHTLERVNNNKGYCKSNCIWATRKIQGMNRAGQSCKLSLILAEAIRDRYAEGRISQRQLGKLFGVHQSQVSRVVNTVTW